MKENKKAEKKYWLNLDQWKSSFLSEKTGSEDKEFINPLPSQEEAQDLWERREFLQLMAAGMALAGTGCMRRPAEKIVPYIKRPDDVVLGEDSFYSSSYYDGGEGFGILVKSREGRPIKIEGNKNHPMNKGSLSARAHSHLLSLYDPQRLQDPQKNLFNEEKSNRESIRAEYAMADKEIAAQIKKGKTAFLTGEWPSPSSQALLNGFCKSHSCKHYVWNPLNLSAIEQAQRQCYGRSLVPHYRLDRARMILAVDCDFLGTWLSPTEFNQMYASGRTAGRDMNRLVVFESLLSLTGTNADWRVRLKPSQQLDLVLSLVHSLIQRGFVKTNWPKHLKVPSSAPWGLFSITQKKWDQLIEDLWNHRSQSLVLAGGLTSQTHQAESLQIAVQWLNNLLGNDGWTIDYNSPYSTGAAAHRNITELITALNKKQIDTVIIHKTNPMYTYPDKTSLQNALKQAELVVYTGDREDETGRESHYILPDHHDLEKWSDWEFQKGVLSIQQPTIRPLYRTRDFESALIQWTKELNKTNYLKGKDTWFSYLKSHHSNWNHLLETGVKIKRSFQQNQRQVSRRFKKSSLAKIQSSTSPKGDYELVLYSTTGLKDGTLANVSWLQEFPDPVTKICWDNYVCVSPATARNKNLKEGQVIELKSQKYSVQAPVHIQPGQADGVLALAIGYGRQRAGKVADKVGVNAYPFMEFSNGYSVFSALPVSMTVTKKKIPLANVQGHHSMEGRQIVVETTLKQYLKNPGGAIHHHKKVSLWPEHKYPKHKWAMVIDLNSCTGCGACVAACQSENNIPTVGKDLVLQGREMHWIRVDRYYKGEPEKPSVVHQPVVCMHCDNAPCETVCPVAATVHSDEGTNDMIYNRCVGTRYCSNNCPYKVRRFNWFNYAKKIEKPLNKALNPDVTVRSRGVMEKCTFCLHRIRSAQAKAKLENRELKDGDIQTACQQSCPANAIVFGDLKDKNSAVSRLFKREDSYSLLEELNTQPAVRYQVKVRNKEVEPGSEEQDHHSTQTDHG